MDQSVPKSAPPCPVFGTCGGCTLQDLNDHAYVQFKENLLQSAFKKVFSDSEFDTIRFAPLQKTLPQSRRRARFQILRTNDELLLGYFKRTSHQIIPIQTCPLLVPEISNLIAPLKEFLKYFLKPQDQGEILALKTEEGLDVTIDLKKSQVKSKKQFEAQYTTLHNDLKNFAEQHNIPHITLTYGKHFSHSLCFKTPTLTWGDLAVPTDSTAFTQPSAEIDEFLGEFVRNNTPSQSRRIADLFCGRGTLTLPLACKELSQRAKGIIHGYEVDEKAHQALSQALSSYTQKTGQTLPFTSYVRNLFEDPLTVEELNFYDTVIIDPPRAGAFHQIRQLSQSNVPTIIMASCNPETFARDAKILHGSGFKMSEVSSIDSFLWSPHVEAAAVFSREKKKVRKKRNSF